MDDWSSFRTTTSEQQRLRAALSGFCESQDLPEEQRAAYTAYLRKRIRSAVEMLIREDDFSKLEIFCRPDGCPMQTENVFSTLPPTSRNGRPSAFS